MSYKNTNLNISLYKNNAIVNNEEILKEIFRIVVDERSKIEKEIIKDLMFKYSLEPIEIGDASSLPEIIKKMLFASRCANVGPMASVAGAIAEILCEKFIGRFDAGIIENGGDIALFGDREFKVKIYAGSSVLSNKFFVSLNPARLFPNKILGICTSSSSVGPSMSFGNTDATTIIANSPAIADAFATSLGNVVKDERDIERVIEYAKKLVEIYGICIIVRNKIGVWNMRLNKI